MKVMFDCGTHLGEGLTYFAGVLKIDETWKIYAFEANPKTYEHLMKMASESEIPNPYIWLQNPNLKLLNVAVWDCESEISFSCGNYDQEKITNLGNDYHNFLSLINERIQEGQLIYNQFDTTDAIDGSSTAMVKHMRKQLARRGTKIQKTIYFEPAISVKSIDFAKFVSLNTSDGDELYCKMDIEGSEFKVMGSLIRRNQLKKFTAIYIEWHNYGNLLLKMKKILIKIVARVYKVQLIDWH
jgi:FkbM family methyltransferase